MRLASMLMLQHFLIGTVAALIFAGAILWFDVGGLAALIAGSPDGELALCLLLVGLVSTFGPIAMFMGLGGSSEEEDSRHG